MSASELVDTSAGQLSGNRRRRWPEALKRQIVAETLEPGSSVSIVACRHDVNANQLFQLPRQLLVKSPASGGALLPVEVVRSRVAADWPRAAAVLKSSLTMAPACGCAARWRRRCCTGLSICRDDRLAVGGPVELTTESLEEDQAERLATAAPVVAAAIEGPPKRKSRPAGRCRATCRARTRCTPPRAPAPLAAGDCAGSARTSPRRSITYPAASKACPSAGRGHPTHSRETVVPGLRHRRDGAGTRSRDCSRSTSLQSRLSRLRPPLRFPPYGCARRLGHRPRAISNASSATCASFSSLQLRPAGWRRRA